MYYINYRYIAIVTHSYTNSVNWSKQYAPGSATHTTGPPLAPSHTTGGGGSCPELPPQPPSLHEGGFPVPTVGGGCRGGQTRVT